MVGYIDIGDGNCLEKTAPRREKPLKPFCAVRHNTGFQRVVGVEVVTGVEMAELNSHELEQAKTVGAKENCCLEELAKDPEVAAFFRHVHKHDLRERALEILDRHLKTSPNIKS